MRFVVAAFDEEFAILGRCSVRVGYWVLLIFVVIKCIKWIARVCGGVNEAVAIE